MQHWIYLQLLLDYGCINTRQIIENIKDISAVPQMTDGELLKLGVPKSRIKKRESVTLKKAYEIYNQCLDNQILIIPYSHKNYPQKLKLMDNPPVVLYGIGDIPDFDGRLSVAVVGPREISEYGGRAAFSLSARLALGGALVISGGAAGGDFYAHQGAMAVSEPTVNVTGGGLLSGYLKRNKRLRREILMGGGFLVTEFAPDYVPKLKNSFHLRNRIIAGLSDAIAVIEAPEKSGTLITAHMGLEQGKEVFALVGNDNPSQYAGCRSLLGDGAKQLTTPNELLSNFSQYSVNFERMDGISPKQLKSIYEEFLEKQKAIEEYIAKKKAENKKAKSIRPKPAEKTKPPVKTEKALKPEVALTGLDPKSKAVDEAFGDLEIFADEIVLKTKLDTATVLTALTMLEVRGLIEALPGSRYRLKID